MPRDSLRKEITDLLNGLDGWRLEPRTTPGASPVWCFVSQGKVECSVSVEGSDIALYVMETDEEVHFPTNDALQAWLGEHRPDALQQTPARSDRKRRARRFFEWS